MCLGSVLYVAPCCCKWASHTLTVWAFTSHPRLTDPLCHVSGPLAPDAVDGHQDAVSGLYGVKDGALHGGVAGAADGEGHVVACLEHVLDAALNIIHDLRHKTTMFRINQASQD